MAKSYRMTGGTRAANAFLGSLLRAGLGPGFMHLLTVRGRRSGRPRSTPVVPVQNARGRWLVAPYGEGDWVRNTRAAGRVTLRRGRASEELAATELSPREAVPVLREYLTMKPVATRVQPYFDVTPDSSDDEFAAEAPRHPVFALSPVA